MSTSASRRTTTLVVVAFLSLIAAACNLDAPSFVRDDAIANYQAIFDTPGAGAQAVAAGSPNAAPTDLDPTTCADGTRDAAFEAQTLSVVNYFREHVGLPLVTDDPIMSADAHRAAMVQVRSSMDFTNGNPHDPFGSGFACVANGTTDAGQVGSARGNISRGWTSGSSTPALSNGPRGVIGQMRDNGGGAGTGVGNETVGHRTAILSPLISRVGLGSSAFHDTSNGRRHSSQVLYWMDRDWFVDPQDATSSLNLSNLLAVQRPDTIDWIAWPPPGYTPDAVTFPRWSFSPDQPGADVDFSNATVTMFRDYAKTMPVTVNSSTFTDLPAPFIGIPDDVLVWEPALDEAVGVDWATNGNGSHLYADVTGADVQYWVFIDGTIVDGAVENFVYYVNVMDADGF